MAGPPLICTPIREAVATSICPFQKCCYCNCQEYMPQNPKTPRPLYSIHHHQLSFLCFKSQLATPRLSVNSFSNNQAVSYVSQIPAASGMNLASALAAERKSRTVGPTTAAETAVPLKTLMRLIEETDGVDLMKNRDKEGGGDGVCCVCMERNKGAAFIPCGHTFCRVCSRELWLNRGCCPICNRSILEILDIF
ncbi:unnamed protein product, partial [Vitis vinifera]